MSNIKVDFSNTGIQMNEVFKYNEKVTKIHEDFLAKKDDEKEFLGWLHLPVNYDKKDFIFSNTLLKFCFLPLCS